MATLFHNCSLLGFEALEGLSTQRVWHGASQYADRDRVKCARGSRAIHYKMNDDECGFHPVLYATLTENGGVTDCSPFSYLHVYHSKFQRSVLKKEIVTLYRPTLVAVWVQDQGRATAPTASVFGGAAG